MTGYTATDVEKMLGLSPARLRAYLRAGLLNPERGAQGELRFSFQDLRLLRTAEGLVRERIPPRRVRQALQRLRARFDDQQPLSGLQLEAEGDRVVVRDGGARWQAESGQVLLDLEPPRAAVAQAAVSMLRPPSPTQPTDDLAGAAASADPVALYELACGYEESDPARARETYLELLSLLPEHADAHVNLGRLLHESGDLKAAEFHYRNALSIRPGDPTAVFNLGVALEDQGQASAALAAYEQALRLNAANADAHYNAARLYEKSGDYTAAVRHLRAYRQLLPKK
jgi:tetratricopeptide (TPR) repeat protein